MICENNYMTKLVKFQKNSVISLMGLKKYQFDAKLDLNKKIALLSKNHQLNIFILNRFLNKKGHFRYKKFLLLLILKEKVKLNKFIYKFLARLDRPFVLGYFGHYLGFLSDPQFKNFINLSKHSTIFGNSKKRVITHKSSTLLKDVFAINNEAFGLLRNARINLVKFKRRDPRFIKTSRVPKTWSIHLRRTYSNFMLTLTNFRGKVITCHTSGSRVYVVGKNIKFLSVLLSIFLRNLFLILSCLRLRK